MSKNDQMHSSQRIVSPGGSTGPAPVAQGVYGERGNLELLVAHASDGLVVHWFNNDRPGSEPVSGIAPGSWSAGLQFAHGTRYRAAQIAQSPLGPDHLEAIALTSRGELEHWTWSPEPGFVRHGTLASAVSDAELTVAADGALRIEVLTDRLERLTLDAAPEGYPARSWNSRAATGAVRNVDAALALVRAASIPLPTVSPRDLRVARSDREGGTLEVTWRDDDGHLVHAAAPLPATLLLA